MLRIIKSKNEWDIIINNIGSYDFYHTHDYHVLSKKRDEEPILILYDYEGVTILLPLLLRPIHGTVYFDLVSVYGYSGPLSSGLPINFDLKDFYQKLQDFFVENKIISVFSRLHPFIPNQETILSKLGTVEAIGRVVNIDITKDHESQLQDYSITTKRYLKKTKEICYSKISSNKKDILKFFELYTQNMKRVGAKSTYFFNIHYFLGLLKCTQFKAEIIYALLKDTDEVISAAMMIKTNNIIQYHLSGTNPHYLYLSPMRFLIDEMRIIGTKEKYTNFNLGGGLGGKVDTLFEFKSSFSKDIKPFKVWKFIANQEVYDQLTQDAGFNDHLEDKNYFPSYRQPG